MQACDSRAVVVDWPRGRKGDGGGMVTGRVRRSRPAAVVASGDFGEAQDEEKREEKKKKKRGRWRPGSCSGCMTWRKRRRERRREAEVACEEICSARRKIEVAEKEEKKKKRKEAAGELGLWLWERGKRRDYIKGTWACELFGLKLIIK